MRLPVRKPKLRIGGGPDIQIAGPGYRFGPAGSGGPPVPLSIFGTWPDDLQVGQPVSPFAPTVTGGAPPYSFATIGTPPSGVTISAATGARSGTPLIAGSYSFTIRVTDSAAETADLPVSGTVADAAPDPLSISGMWPDDLQVGQTVSPFAPTVTGGTPPYTFSVIGTAPSGVTINPSTGARGGTPAIAGPYSFTIRATDSATTTADLPVSGTVAAPTIDPLPMSARRSIKFPAHNGLHGMVALALPAFSNWFRSGSSFEAHEFILRLNLNPQSNRLYSVAGIPTSNNLNRDYSIFGLGATSALNLQICGVHSTQDSGAAAGRLRFRLGTAPLIIYSPRLWTDEFGNWLDLPSDDFTMFLRSDGTDIWITIVRPDGSAEDGPKVPLGGYTGLATASNLWVGAANTGINSFNGLKNGALSDLALVRRSLTADERLRIGQGEEVADVLGTFPGFHYRLSGVDDLAQTSGTDAMAAISLVDSGQTTPGLFRLHSGGTLCGNRNSGGSVGVMVDHSKLWDGLVFPKRRSTNVGEIQIPIRNTGSAASHFEARLVTWLMDNSQPTTAVTPWTRITASPLAPGASTIGLLSHEAGPWRQVEVRSEADPAVRAATMVTGIGTVVELHGQSEIEQMSLFPLATENVALRDTDTPAAETNMCSYVKNMCRTTASTYTPRARVERARVESISCGYGLTALAKEWQAQHPNECAMFINFSVSGAGRTQWTNNAAISGSYLYFGTLGVANSGEVADIQLATFPDPATWPTTAAIFYPSISESTNASTANDNFRAYFFGIGSPTRTFDSLYALNPATDKTIVIVPHGRAFGTGVVSATNAQVAERRTDWINRTAGVTLFADTPPPSGWSIIRAAPNNVILYLDAGDAIHPGKTATRYAQTVSGRIWFAKGFIHALELAGNLTGAYNPAALALPSTFGRATPDTGTTLTISLPASSLGNWSRRAGSGTMDRLWDISTDGGATWRNLVETLVSADADIEGTATLSGNTVTIECAALSSVSDANLRVRYHQLPMMSSNGTNPQAPSETAARQLENELIDGCLVIPDARFGVEVVGYPLFDHNKVLTAA